MDKSGVAKRYAEAIYDIAKSSNNIDEVKEIFENLVKKYNSEHDLKKFLNNPTIEVEKKIEFLKKMFPSISEITLKSISYIIEKERVILLQDIKENLLKIYYEENNSMLVKGTFAKELTETQINKLKEKLKKKYKKNIVLKLEVDENLIGGGVLKAGNEVINGSIRNQIEDLKRIF